MAVGEAFKLSTVLNLADLSIDASALYFLAAPSIPNTVRAEAIERAEAGETITLAEAERIVAEKVTEALWVGAKERGELVDEIARLRGAADPEPDPPEPSIADAVDLMCRLTGKKSLSARQKWILPPIR